MWSARARTSSQRPRRAAPSASATMPTIRCARAPVLIASGKNAAGTRVGIDPLTGQQFNVAFIGTFAPGHGDPAMGMVSGGSRNFPQSLYTGPALMPAPRFGLAFDPFGKRR